MQIRNVFLFFLPFVVVLTLSYLLTATGCDETQQMIKPVVKDVTQPADTEPPTMVGEMKKPEASSEPTVAEDEVREPADTEPQPELLPDTGPYRTPADIVEVSYYSDPDLTKELILSSPDAIFTLPATLGTTIYSKVVFSNDVPIVFSNDSAARPYIGGKVGKTQFQYRMRPRYISIRDLRNGDARPYKQTNNIFICKYIPQPDDVGEVFYTDDGRAFSANLVPIHTSLACEVPRGVLTAFVHDPTRQNLSHFVGQVLALVPESVDLYFDTPSPVRSYGTPMSGVVVTIMSGPQSGEQSVTDADGWYFFPNVKEDELHLRVEKECLEPKEVFVHRFRPTTLPSRSISVFDGDPQMLPGVILMGHAWPERIREVLEQTTLPPDLLLVAGPYNRRGNAPAGAFYTNGVVVASSPEEGLYWYLLHEIGHAHQHAVALLNGGRSPDDWVQTPEGIAFLKAREADWKTVGKLPYEDPEHKFAGDGAEYFISPIENSAEFFQYWWREKLKRQSIWGHLKDVTPNRFKWAEEWLKK